MNEEEFERILKKKNERIQELEIENNKLKRRLLAYENAHTPPSLSKKKRIPRATSGKLGAPLGHPKYERADPKIDEEVLYQIKDTCPFCNNPLDSKDILEIIEEEIPDMKEVKGIKHLIEWSFCQNCKRKVIAKNNAPATRFGPNLKSKITLLKHDDRLPLRKVEQSLLRDHNFTISNSGIMKVIRQVAEKLKEPYYEVVKTIRSSNHAYVDETSYKLNGETWWLWTFVCENTVLFVIRKSRSKKVVEEILGKEYKGIIVCDGWKVYEQFTSRLQRCWAHLLRESYHLKEKHKGYEKYHNQLKNIFDKIIQIRLKPPAIEERLLIIEGLKNEILELVRRIKFEENYKKFATTIENGLGYWFTCLEHLEIEPTNNYAEQALRELIVQRKIMGGLRSEKGAETLEVVSTMITTWKKQEKPLMETMKLYV
ncbi:MAG: IS66 family transposase [Nanoarchaeota archaeon]|nr:IS66 family transposase [Nanoarchaeota archaeon]MBU1854129.1 IS66 family transposase [Nanoarchaeota archaeon]